MLSALIGTEHSYPTLLLAKQLVDQRFVHPGPLVTYFSYHYECRLYLFPSRLSAKFGNRHIIEVKKLLSLLRDYAQDQSLRGY